MPCSAPVTIAVFLCDMKPSSNVCVPSTFAIKPAASKQNNWTKVATLPSLGRRSELASPFQFEIASSGLQRRFTSTNRDRFEINRAINTSTCQGVKE